MKIFSDHLSQGGVIPAVYAWGRIGPNGETVRSSNRTPDLHWTEIPDGTRSFVLACLDDDMPTDRNERDARGEIPAFQTRCRFVHWVQADIPLSVTEIPEDALTEEKKLTAGFGRVGINDYSRGQTVLPGDTGSGYDGPCPPSFDARWHYYRYMVIAVDLESLSLPESFRWEDVERAVQGHVLATAELVCRYSLNPRMVNPEC